ncbi:dipicolinic acid synthetase B subunit [Clostridium sp. CAG:1219]|nr:dipicolinic acid synthetase B subunit [Clostridium sp. CAG:1219]
MFENLNIGLGITGSFCNFKYIKEVIYSLQDEGANVIPIVSENVKSLDTRFYKSKDFLEMLESTTKNKVISSIVEAEPIGPKNILDILVICPCTGNTLAKIANGITDSTILMAIKSHIRKNKPVVIGISTNDGLGAAFENIGKVINTKNFYFVPFSQDDPINKPKSLVLDYSYILDTIKEALENRQIQPILSK